MMAELQYLPPEKQDTQLRKRIEDWIDAGHGSCVLRNPQIAELVIENWRHYAKMRYDLISYVVMPNHVHVLIRVYESFSLAKIVQSWKGYTGKKIKEMITVGIAGNADCPVGSRAKPTLGDPREAGNAGNADCPVGSRAKPTLGDPRRRIWHREFWDRYIRDEKHFNSAIDYIAQNPIKAGLVKNAEDWPWTRKE
jgi:REP element-mobilizing transposase RayT